jgi:hypothetical protein
VAGNVLICLAHRVRTEVGNAPLHDGLVFFWSSCLAIVGCEFRKIRPSDDERHAAVSIVRLLALRIGTIKIGLLAVLLKRDGNERPRSHKLLRRLRDRRPPPLWAEKLRRSCADVVMKDKMRRFMVPEQQKGSDRVEGPNRSSEVWQQVSYVPLQSLRGETGRERE